MPIDSTDKKILKMLLDSGRVSYTDISKEIGMKPPSVIERVKRMETEGIIKSYTVNVDYSKLGYDLKAYVGVVLDDSANTDAMKSMISELDDSIVRCYYVTGDFTLLLQVITQNTSSLEKVIKKIRSFPGVIKTNTIVIFSTVLERVRDID